MNRNRSGMRYLRVIKKSLPCGAAQKRRCLDGLGDSVRMYLREHPDAAMDELYSVFGTPDSIVESYLETADTSQLSRRLSRRKFIIGAIVIAVVFVAVISTVAVSIAYDLHDIKNGYFVDELLSPPPDAKALGEPIAEY